MQCYQEERKQFDKDLLTVMGTHGCEMTGSSVLARKITANIKDN